MDLPAILEDERNEHRRETFLDHLLGVDNRRRVNASDKKVQRVEKGAREIVTTIVERVGEADDRFIGRLINSGSFYEGVKVGEPDEFDYMVELNELSQLGVCRFVPTEDASFIRVLLQDQMMRERWDDYITTLCLHDKRKRQCHMCRDSAENFPQHNEIMAPESVRARFKKLIDEVTSHKEFPLPDGWEHGGVCRPQFSGIRNHGPAVLLQFVLVDYEDEKELKVNLDITLCLRVPRAESQIRSFRITPLYNLKPTHRTHQLLMKGIKSEPGIHVVPLHSKYLEKIGRKDNRLAWRISTSGLEKLLLDQWPYESVPKMCLRLLKYYRDSYLTVEDTGKPTKRRNPRRSRSESNNRHDSDNEDDSAHQDRGFRKGRRRKRNRRKNKHNDKRAASHSTGRMGCCNETGADWDAARKVADYTQCSSHAQANYVEYNFPMMYPGQYVNWNLVYGTVPFTRHVHHNGHPHPNSMQSKRPPRTGPGMVAAVVPSTCSVPDLERKETSEQVREWEMLAGRVSEKSIPFPWCTEKQQRARKKERRHYDSTDDSPETDTEYQYTPDEAHRKRMDIKSYYQNVDISFMHCQPGTGEYYGAETYVSSMELKTHMFMLFERFPREQGLWPPSKLPELVVCALASIADVFSKNNKYIKSYFFDRMVTSPMDKKTREHANAALQKLLDHLKEKSGITSPNASIMSEHVET